MLQNITMIFVSAGSDTAIIFPEIAYPNLIFPSPASTILKFSDTYISLYVRKLLARLAPWPILYIVKKERKKCSVEFLIIPEVAGEDISLPVPKRPKLHPLPLSVFVIFDLIRS